MLLLRLVLKILCFAFIYSTPSYADPEIEMATRCLKSESKRELSGKLLTVLTALPTPPVVAVEEAEGLSYLTSSAVFSRILGTASGAVILNDSEELRFLPYTLADTHVLLVIRTTGDWSDSKARKVLNVAKLQGNPISLVWLNESPIPRSFRTLVKESGGRAFSTRDLNRLVLRHVCSR